MHSDSQRSKTVYIIDDSSMMRSMLRLGASEAGLTVVGEAGTAQAALAHCGQVEPDIILLDLGLPDGDGLELLTALQTRLPRAFVIVVTGNNGQEAVRSAVSRGARGFVVKPFSIGTITDALTAANRKLARRS